MTSARGPPLQAARIHVQMSPEQARKPERVDFERSTAGFSSEIFPKAKAAQMKLEHYYKVAVDAAIERNGRRVELERKLQQDMSMSDQRKQRQLQQLGIKVRTATSGFKLLC